MPSIKVKADIEKAKKPKVPVSHIREATDKAQKPDRDFFLVNGSRLFLELNNGEINDRLKKLLQEVGEIVDVKDRNSAVCLYLRIKML